MTLEKPNIIHDLIIVGSGPAGCTASIYASRYKISHLLIGSLPGGLITEAHKVCNFPGFEEISGMEYGQKIMDQAKKLGAEFIMEEIVEIQKVVDQGKVTQKRDVSMRKVPQEHNKKRKIKNIFVLESKQGNIYKSHSVLLATGTKRHKLGLPREKELMGKGISYCATCDASFYRNQVVAVIGGSDAATTSALLLADIASKVYIIYRGNQLRGEEMWIDQVEKNKKIEVLYDKNVIGLLGDKMLEAVKLDNSYNDSDELRVDGVFVEIGSVPALSFIDSKLETTKNGYIKIANDQSTSINGLYAAGDITNGSNGFRQVVTACAEGAIASKSIHSWLKKQTTID